MYSSTEKVTCWIEADPVYCAVKVLLHLQVPLGIVCGCIRKIRKWPLSSIVREFEQFVDPEGSFHDVQYIEHFEMGEALDQDKK